MKVALCIIFNHPFPSNIPIIRSMYENKFDHLLFVQPLNTQSDKDVIVSYRGSYNFQGMIYDSVEHLLKLDCDFVLFMQDDCLLNPYFTSENIVSEFGASEDRPFFGNFEALSGSISRWHWILPTICKAANSKSTLFGTGFENFIRYIPDPILAKVHLERYHRLSFGPILAPDKSIARYGVAHNEMTDIAISNLICDDLFGQRRTAQLTTSYPWVFGMSDFFIVSYKSLRKIKDFLGITAAAGIFAEVAIPTALTLHHETISTSSICGWRLDYFWGNERAAITTEAIIESFNDRCAMIHPVKLSSDFEIVKQIYM